MSISNIKDALRKITGMMSLAGATVALLGLGTKLLIAGLVLFGLVMMLPGSPYGDPPDPASAPDCPECGVQMVYVEPDLCQCKDHGRYLEDEEGLSPWP